MSPHADSGTAAATVHPADAIRLPDLPTETVPAVVRPSRLPHSLARGLADADIRINGGRPWDITLNDARLMRRLRVHGMVGLGDAYVDGWWDCPAIDQFFDRALRSDLPRLFAGTPNSVWTFIKESLFNLQTLPRAITNVRRHYNLGNDLFQATLDPLMVYSCGYWRTATTLADAQIAKLDLV